MIDITPLEAFKDLRYYSAHFMDLQVWEKYVREVCQWHSYDCSLVKTGVPGTFPTFIIETGQSRSGKRPEPIVVKFFGPVFEGERSFFIERDISRWLEKQPLIIPSPGVLGEGQLEQGWRYLIFDFVPGISIGQARDQLSSTDWFLVATQVGRMMRQLHDMSTDGLVDLASPARPSLEQFSGFLARQGELCYSNHKAWNDLPAELLEQVEDFILPAEQLIDFSAKAHLIHADLTADHLVGRLENGRWHFHAIIDWGDARTGNILCEQIPLYMDLFRSDISLLRVCLEAYSLGEFYRSEFPRKVLSMMLLDLYPIPAFVLEHHRDARTLDELAERLFAS